MPWQDNGGGNNNPWGRGSGGGQQPPDLDEMIKRGQDRLKRIIPGGGKFGFTIMFVVLALLWGASGFYTVGTSEQGVVLRFGEWVRTETPGLKWHIPFPVETVILPNVTRENRIDIGFRSDVNTRRSARQQRFPEESLMLTGDENIVEVAFTILWRVNDAGKFLFNIQSPQEVTIKAVAESVMRDIIGRTEIQKALTEGRLEIEEEALGLTQAALDHYEAGITITQVKLERVDPPGQVIDAFRDVQAAEADRERYRNEAEAYANSIIPDARGRANRLIQEGQAYKQQVIAQAEGEAARFISVHQEYVQAKDVTLKRIYLETMEQIFSGMNKIILDEGAGSGVVPYLPLPEIRARNQGSGGGQ